MSPIDFLLAHFFLSGGELFDDHRDRERQYNYAANAGHRGHNFAG
jgi:hypothetical protein